MTMWHALDFSFSQKCLCATAGNRSCDICRRTYKKAEAGQDARQDEVFALSKSSNQHVSAEIFSPSSHFSIK